MSWSEDEFFEKALGQKHPLEEDAQVPDRTKIAILTILTEGVEKWCRDSDGLLKKLARERDMLYEKEQQLKAGLPEQVRGVNAGKTPSCGRRS